MGTGVEPHHPPLRRVVAQIAAACRQQGLPAPTWRTVKARLLRIDGRVRAALGLWCIHSSPVRLRLHIAFTTELEQVKKSVAVLRSKGIVPRSSGGGPELNEPTVFPWMPAASVYFDDPDGHLLGPVRI